MPQSREVAAGAFREAYRGDGAQAMKPLDPIPAPMDGRPIEAECSRAKLVLLGLFIVECLFAVYLVTRGWW